MIKDMLNIKKTTTLVFLFIYIIIETNNKLKKKLKIC